ncbi:hypothetical protein SALBM135S_08423 [Streptomyces alboniger]
MEWLTAPFEVTFVQRALWGGILVSAICALAGTWVVLRGMAFLGDAMSHGLLPGVALAALFGGNLLVGAVASAAVMTAGVTALSRMPRLSQDTGIGLLFVGMLSLGVIIVSRSQSFAVDLTGFLFGDVLAVRQQDLYLLAGALLAALVVSVLGHRAFLALAFDSRKARTLGLRPRLAHAVLLGLLGLAIVASFHIVGTLLVLGLLIAPPGGGPAVGARCPWRHGPRRAPRRRRHVRRPTALLAPGHRGGRDRLGPRGEPVLRLPRGVRSAAPPCPHPPHPPRSSPLKEA